MEGHHKRGLLVDVFVAKVAVYSVVGIFSAAIMSVNIWLITVLVRDIRKQ